MKTSRQISISRNRKAGLAVLALAAAVMRAFSQKTTRENVAVVIEPYGMGDAVSLLPMARGLATVFESVHILTKPQWAPIFSDVPKTSIHGINISWTNYSLLNKYRISRLWDADWRAFKAKWKPIAQGAIGFDPRGDIRSILFLYLIGCSKVYTLDHYLGTDAKIPKWAARTKRIDQNQQRWRIGCDLVATAGYRKSCEGPPSIQSGKYKLRSVKKIAFLPVAPWQGKLWTTEKWQELLSRVRAQGFAIHGLCGPQQKFQVQEILGIEAISECTTISSWIKSLSEIDLLITLDSGPMHLADALGVPLVALFGSSPVPLWTPSGKFTRVLHHQDTPHFRPIHQIEGNEKLGKALMEKITVEEVFDCIQNLVYDLKIAHSVVHTTSAKCEGDSV